MRLPQMPKSPRILHRMIIVRVLASSVMLGGCVEATAYEQATSAAEVQAEGRRRVGDDLERKSAELLALSQETERLRAENARLQAELAERQGAVDQAALDLVLAKQERSEEASLVQQLRGDLARVGSDLDVFADEKADLAAELAAVRSENERLTARMATAEGERVANEPEPVPSQPEPAATDAADSPDAAADAPPADPSSPTAAE